MFDNLAASRLVTLLAIVAVGGCSAASTNRYESLRQRAFTGVEKSSDETVVAARPGREAWAETVELSLAALRSLAVARNPSLAAMRAAWQAAVERYPQVVALDDPQIGYSLAPATVASGSTSFGQKIEVSQHFPWPGKLRLRGEAALGRVEVAGDDFEDARQHLLQSVAHTFYAYQFVHRALAINRAKQELLVEFRRVAEGRYAAGLASKSDALQAEVEHQYVVHGAIVLERERAVIRARLNTLLNLPPRDPLPPPRSRLRRRLRCRRSVSWRKRRWRNDRYCARSRTRCAPARLQSSSPAASFFPTFPSTLATTVCGTTTTSERSWVLQSIYRSSSSGGVRH